MTKLSDQCIGKKGKERKKEKMIRYMIKLSNKHVGEVGDRLE